MDIWFYLITIERTDGKKEYRVADSKSNAKETVEEWEEIIKEENDPDGYGHKFSWYKPEHKSVSMREISLHELNGILRNVHF